VVCQLPAKPLLVGVENPAEHELGTRIDNLDLQKISSRAPKAQV
jgi:hypothetical protein